MFRQLLKVGKKIRVSRIDTDEVWYDSTIQDVNEKNFFIDIPYQDNLPLVLQRGDQVRANLALENERLEFITTVVGFKLDNIPLFILSLPKNYNRIQNRKFYRLPIMIEIFYAELEEGSQQQEFHRSYTLDISGGGVRILVSKAYAKGTCLVIKIPLPCGDIVDEICVLGRVIRSGKIESSPASYAAIEFTDITRSQQDKIVKFIFNKLIAAKRTNFTPSV